MDHAEASRLISYQTENPGHLSEVQLSDYIWLVEQLLQELRQAQVERRPTPGSRRREYAR